jgi:hypothetical protein
MLNEHRPYFAGVQRDIRDGASLTNSITPALRSAR